MRLALVTGGESGIGAACAARLAKVGADVVISYFRDLAGARASATKVEDAGRRALTVQCDVGDERSVRELFDAAEKLGTVDWLVNSAGINMSGKEATEMDAAEFDRTIATDLRGPFLTCREFAERLEGKPGRIVNLSSIHESAPREGGAAYDAAKGGLAQLTRTLALELAAKKIAVNGVAPGMILTPMNQSAIDDPQELCRREAAIPWGRSGTAEEVAELVAYLLSGAADYITGATVVIDGGLSLTIAQGA